MRRGKVVYQDIVFDMVEVVYQGRERMRVRMRVEECCTFRNVLQRVVDPALRQVCLCEHLLVVQLLQLPGGISVRGRGDKQRGRGKK